ncbi:hypothetical protein GGTG_01046 [Gaeumannomyces tritici R3-111a-1]|uniref:Extracellular membrane protein CFEM domain-containing protein n=1 Tax=Gaeumannomyces tritici (strain R3-111a-1) TaxID=644352 RepID=J3NIG5_GAET3|nr:hypothetical protein GGTG_01046 [Gaeumannomyces tritici R3-111a-1]EJT81058.1 hypothetical protein GGTG_01046 [Gaeumannomyces tritici R3-111a-1]
MVPKSTCSIRPSTLLAQAVLLMASSVSALTLSDFQSIASTNVPLGCIMAYNRSPLAGCSQSDFTAGSGCGSRCVRSLGLMQTTLQIVCDGASVPAGSVLRAALQGSLVDTLCGRGLQPPQTTSITTRLVLPPSTSILPPPPATTSTRRIPPPSQPPLSSTFITTSVATSVTTSRGSPSLTPIPVTPVIPPPLSSSGSSENGTPVTPLPTGTPATTSTRRPQETATALPQTPGQGGQRGGGSPFDPVVVAGAQHALLINPMAVLAWASAVGLLVIEGVVP